MFRTLPRVALTCLWALLAASPTLAASGPHPKQNSPSAPGHFPPTPAECVAAEHLSWDAIPLPGGRLVRLKLWPLPQDPRLLPLTVDGLARPDLLMDADCTVWVGSAQGDPSSEARFVFSRFGSQGSLRFAGELWRWNPKAPGSPWSMEGEAPSPNPPKARCRLAAGLSDRGSIFRPLHTGTLGQIGAATSCSPRVARIAIEADSAYHNRFPTEEAQAVHVAGLLLHMAHIYERDAGIRLEFTEIALHGPAFDPWVLAPGSDCEDALALLRDTFPEGPPNDAHSLLLLSGAPLGCSASDTTLLGPLGFGVAGSLDGQGPSFDQPRSVTWDLLNVSHTLAHIMGAIHTESYCPPLDLCAPVQHFGLCQDQQLCTTGTLMGACHLCSGGLANVTARFHPVVAAELQQFAEASLPPLLELDIDLPEHALPGEPIPILLQTSRPQLSAPHVLFRYQPEDPWSERPLQYVAPNTWRSMLPPAHCGERLECHLRLADSACGEQFVPELQQEPLMAIISQLEPLLEQDFESPNAWLPVDLGASDGDWEWAVPLAPDPNYPWPPTVAASGQLCWVTANQVGNSDVDGGFAGLQSPLLDLAQGPFAFRYAYYLAVSNPGPLDFLAVEVLGPGSGGEWVQVAQHHVSADHQEHWRHHEVDAEALTAAGISGGPGVRIRIVAADALDPSIVEAGIDDFELSAQACTLGFLAPPRNATAR